MGRPLRTTAGGLVYHVLNRANARMQIFDKDKETDYDAFERILDEAEQWRWSSVGRRQSGDAACQAVLCPWRITMPKDWLRRLNRAESQRELAALRRCANRSQPYGSDAWVAGMTKRFGLQSAFRPQGRPRKESRKNGS